VYSLIFEQNLVEIDGVISAVTLSTLTNTYDAPWGLLCDNTTSSTKPEVLNLLQHRQGRVEPPPQSTRTENLVKFGHLFFEICEQTDTQTDTLIAILHRVRIYGLTIS